MFHLVNKYNTVTANMHDLNNSQKHQCVKFIPYLKNTKWNDTWKNNILTMWTILVYKKESILFFIRLS